MQPKEKTPKLIGQSVGRLDVQEKVTGAAIYADDIQFGKGLLYARLKRSPYPHALIKGIDTSRAQALPGVKVVVTGADFPNHIGLYLKDRTIFALDQVRFVGEPVAGVAAARCWQGSDGRNAQRPTFTLRRRHAGRDCGSSAIVG